MPELVCEWLNGQTDSQRFLRSILQNKNSVWPRLNCMDGSVLALMNCTDGSVLVFLNCTDGSVLTHLNGSYGSVLSHLRFPTQSGLTRFPQSGVSLVPWLLCKKSNKKSCLKYNVISREVGYRLHWDRWTSQQLPTCHHLEQYRSMLDLSSDQNN